MPTRSAQTSWSGSLEQGSGQVELTSSGIGTYDVSFPKRAADDAGGTTSPEELIAAAHAGCFTMALSAKLGEAGFVPVSIDTQAKVELALDGGPSIAAITLQTHATVPGLGADAFHAIAEDAKRNCPVSRALAAVPIALDAVLDG